MEPVIPEEDSVAPHLEPRPQKSKKLLVTILGSSLLFFALGIGNVLVGMLKSHEYNALITRALYEIEHDERPVIPLVDGSLNINSQTKHIQRLQYRLDYYNLVALGGKVFLAIAGALLLCCLLVRNVDSDQDDLN